VNWGAGRGFDAKEFKTFDVPMKESYDRFREVVEVVVKAWTNERLTYQGKYFSFEDVEVLPKPLQQPHPPMWVAAGSPDAIDWAASVGHSILMDPHSTHVELGEKKKFYRQKLAAYGYSMEGRDIPMARLLAIDSTDAAAAEGARQGAQWLLKTYVDPRMFGVVGDPVQRYVDSVVIHGTVERVIDELARLREEIDLQYMIGAPLGHKTFMAFTEQVLPKFL
jgi:alkanesulfonate monooxygenase SsuD/methylene tetrahydromethanopterin reductase-like flavin-dependent oxidoreductase (luciferase family)